MNLNPPNDSPSFHVMAKVTGPICNLDCTYCFYLEKERLYPAGEQWKMRLDVLESLVHSARQRRFGEEKRETLPQYCRHCNVKFACNGECPKHRFAKAPDGEDGLNYLCPGYQHFFRHIDYAMRFMAGELRMRRAPANIRVRMSELDRNPPERNDPCYCGSGKKYKRCHGG